MTEYNVVCVHCDREIYKCAAIGRNFTGAPLLAEDFEPLDPTVPMPIDGEELICPMCGEVFVAEAGDDKGVVLKLTGDAWWPHPPLGKR